MLLVVAIPTRASGNDPILLHVAVTNRGPVHVGDSTRFWIFATNTNVPGLAAPRRDLVNNAYVVNSISVDVFVNGTHWAGFPLSTLPGTGPGPGHPPVEVVPGTCSGGTCAVSYPAVLPGENIAVQYFGWVHGSPTDPLFPEPNGNYVFVITLHGSLNGVPMDVAGASSTIVMTW